MLLDTDHTIEDVGLYPEEWSEMRQMTLKNIQTIDKELNEAIENVENAMGADNDYDCGYYNALLMVRDKILH